MLVWMMDCKFENIIYRRFRNLKDAMGTDDVEDHIGGILSGRARLGSISLLYLGGARQHCSRGCRGHGGVVFGGSLRHQGVPRLFVSR